MIRAAALALSLAALFLGAGAPTAAAQPPQLVVEGGGGCGVCRFYDDGGWNVVSTSIPVDRCASALPGGSHSVACAGWSYWDRTRVWKNSGGSIRVGFWYRNYQNFPTMSYRIAGASWNGGAVTFDRTEGLATPYNVSTCAYDFSYGGAQSYVICEGIDW
jgi:hypothetical protein